MLILGIVLLLQKKQEMNSVKILVIACLSMLVFGLNAQILEVKPAPDGVTVNQVIDNYIKALGGKDKLLKISSVSTWAKASIQGNEIIIITHSALPNKFYMEMGTPDITFQTQVFNGEKGVVMAMGNKTEITGDRLEQLKFEATLFNEIKYAELGAVAELLGVATHDNTEVYVIKVTPKTGPVFFEYYDIKTGFKLMTETKIESPEGKFVMITKYSDYKAVKGVYFPHKVVQEIAAQTIESIVTLIQINKVKDKIFEIN